MVEARRRPIFSSRLSPQCQPELSKIGSVRGTKPWRKQRGGREQACDYLHRSPSTLGCRTHLPPELGLPDRRSSRRRQIMWLGATRHPMAEWITCQLIEAHGSIWRECLDYVIVFGERHPFRAEFRLLAAFSACRS